MTVGTDRHSAFPAEIQRNLKRADKTAGAECHTNIQLKQDNLCGLLFGSCDSED